MPAGARPGLESAIKQVFAWRRNATRRGREQNRSDSSVVLGHNAVVLKAGQPPSKLSIELRHPKVQSNCLFDMAPHMARRRGSFYEELGAGDPVGAGAETSAALGLIRTAALAFCKRALTNLLGEFPTQISSRTPHHEWLIRT